MPTNLIKPLPIDKQAKKKAGGPHAADPGQKKRQVVIEIGKVRIRAELAQTMTAERFWFALPIYSAAEPWGDSIHFETHVESGRERGARVNGILGEIYYWAEDDRVIIAYGPTPISRPGEIRLPRPCNVLAKALDDVRILKNASPGEKVSVTALK